MSAVLLFGIHCHQPVGNFESVFERAFENAYLPFVREATKAPSFKFSLHMTGPLLEWIKEKRGFFFDIIGRLVSDGRLEIQISGFYEPVLAAIRSEDRREQIELAKEFVKTNFGVVPEGLWLTERVWDPRILRDLVACGIKYVIVDDYHLLCAGVKPERALFITEDEGERLFIFPISERLRYLIPFRPVDEVIGFLEEKSDFLTIYDDGEKFGLWPGTKEWVYEKGWLKAFLRAVEDGRVKTMLFSEALEAAEPERVYLPICSYFEMGEWSLETELAAGFLEFVEDLKSRGIFEKVKPFVRGGIWHNFLVKYPEANRMHKRQLWVSKHLDRGNEKAKIFLFKAQCNDAYWHGVFGGLYLPHLRRAVYRNLLKAEEALKLRHDVFLEDIDCDGRDEIFFFTKNFDLWIFPFYGAQAREFSVRAVSYNFFDTLSRRLEHYHLKALGEAGPKGVASIHEIPKRLDSLPETDKYERGSFIDRIFFENEVLWLNGVAFEIKGLCEDRAELLHEGRELKVKKTYKLFENGFEVEYLVETEDESQFEFEVNLNPATPEAEILAQSESFEVTERVDLSDVKSLSVVSPLFGGRTFKISLSESARFFSVPICTVSQSEKGFDRILQCVALIFKFEEKTRRRAVRAKVEVV